MARTRLTVHFGPGFSRDLWAWNLSLAEAPSGRVEVVWATSAFEPTAEREHRFRARSMPDWWPELLGALARVQFGLLPPSRNWTVAVDDAATLSVELQQDGLVSAFSIFYAPELWPGLPDQTSDALQHVVAILDPIARDLHKSSSQTWTF
jgi:hypothetical protein